MRYISQTIATGTLKVSFPIRDAEVKKRVRYRSKAVLGNKDRAEVGAAVGLHPDGVVNATDLALELGLPNTRVRAQLLALVDGGYLETVPSLSEKKMYERLPAKLWDACIELVATSAPVDEQGVVKVSESMEEG